MKKLQVKKAIQKPITNLKKDVQKHFSDMGIGFRVVDMHANQLATN